MTVALDGRHLTLEALEDVALRGAHVQIDPAAAEGMEASRAVVEAILRRGETVYGINTGFGHLAQVRIEAADLERLQRNLIRSHAVGVGPPFDVPTVRAIMLLRANVLAAGHSGVRPLVAERLAELLNGGIHPLIPSQGSVGASGDLAPLSHLALVLIGEGRIWDGGAPGTPTGIRSAKDVLASRSIEPLVLAPKEGLALINGTQAMTGLGALVLLRAERLARVADAVAALSLEGRLGSHVPFDPVLHELRPHPGQIAVASNFRLLLGGGTIHDSHTNCGKVQDAYSFRCAPQVHGASRDAIAYVRAVLEREVNAVTDNPTVFADDGRILSGGNFHGQPVAMALDFLAIAIAEIGSIAERRIEQLVNPKLNELPAFLSASSGLHSGFMMAQVTAAALVSENKGLCFPASVDSVPTSANQEDHVSMGPIAARKALVVLENVEAVVAIEALCAAQAADFRAPLTPADGALALFDEIRSHVPKLVEDRELHLDIEAITSAVRDGSLLAAVERRVGRLA